MMYFRCARCQAATWVDRATPLAAAERVSCGGCGRGYTAHPAADLGSTPAEHYRRTLEFANQRRIDMPSAYAQLLGLEPEETLGAASGAPSPSPAALLDFDPEFTSAVAQGHLTVEQALGRGSRAAFASSLVRRHGMALEMAEGVADNRLSLHEAMQRTAAARRAESKRRRRVRGVRLLHALAVVSLAGASVGGVGRVLWARSFPSPSLTGPQLQAETRGPVSASVPARPTVSIPPPLAATAVRRDANGRIVEIIGPDPAAVLETYCRSTGETAALVPREITDTVPKLGNARYGLFQDTRRSTTLLAIWIREDRQTRRWVAGDGLGPIPVNVAPAFPEGAFRKSIEPRAG